MHRMKRAMPPERKRHSDKYSISPLAEEEGTEIVATTGTSHLLMNNQGMQSTIASTTITNITFKHQHQQQRTTKQRKHNDSISESILIKEKLPSSSLSTIGKNNNILIPRNNHNILNSIDLKGTDGAALKKLMNNNNGDLTNGDDGFNNEEDDDNDEIDDNSDSETVTGDESLFDPEDEETESEEEEEEEDDDEDYVDADEEYNRRINNSNSKKKNSVSIME